MSELSGAKKCSDFSTKRDTIQHILEKNKASIILVAESKSHYLLLLTMICGGLINPHLCFGSCFVKLCFLALYLWFSLFGLLM